MLTRRSATTLLGASALATLVPARASTVASSGTRQVSYRPGKLWLDTAGKPIWIHGGSIITVGDTFYWYGENKEHTTGKDKIWHWGVRAYKSSDLVNWQDVGTIIPPEPNNPSSPLHPFKYMDRPHIIYNSMTKKYVAWLKIMEDPWQTRAVLIADAITGPYQLLGQSVRPLGMGAGDFDLVSSPDDAKAYMIFERVHSELIVADLTEEYTGFSGFYSTHFPRPGPPSVREGAAHFHRQGKHYLVTSGTTGYFPNPSEIAVAETYHGPWTSLGDLHPGDTSRTSYNTQISSVFKHPGKRDLYIALADRWFGDGLSGPEFENGELSRKVQIGFRKRFASPPEPLNAEEAAAMKIAGPLEINTSQARHVWLPVNFEGPYPVIKWRDGWSLSEFD